MVAEVQNPAFVLRIPQTIYQEMVAHIVESYPNEGCGVVGSKDGLVVKHYPTANAADEPDDFSIIAEADLVRIYNDVDSYDGDMIYYHSHPRSEAYPSARDKEWAKRSGYLYIIFSHRFYPEPPYVRVFSIDLNGDVTEGKVEIVD
jgi:proteasome lid subunit RPN8/RPN11